MSKKLNIALLGAVALLSNACSNKKIETPYKKSFDFWEKNIEIDLKEENYEKLKTDFLIFSNEHRSSSYIPDISRHIIKTLIENKEWEEVMFYIDNHRNRYITDKDEDLILYYLIKSRFNLLSLPNRLQQKYIELLDNIKEFKKEHKNSNYIKEINIIERKLIIKKSFFDKDIADLYKRIGKDEAFNIYTEKYISSNIDLEKEAKPKSPLYRRIFEGDGSAGWIGFFIPTGKNIVSEGHNENK
jgi:outer membrane protein assembly factor BamD (BamD/ComL family)